MHDSVEWMDLFSVVPTSTHSNRLFVYCVAASWVSSHIHAGGLRKGQQSGGADLVLRRSSCWGLLRTSTTADRRIEIIMLLDFGGDI